MAARVYRVRFWALMHDRLHTWISEHEADARDLLERFVGISSWSHDPVGLTQSAAAIAEAFGAFGTATIEPVDVTTRITDAGEVSELHHGPAVRVRSDAPGPRVLLVSHHDTVFSPDVPFAWEVNGDRITGPGVVDAKGGLAQVWLALGALQAAGLERAWELLIVPDEEIGSPGSARMIREASAVADIGFGFEPSFPDGSLAAGRAGSANYSFVVRGRSAHAGREHHLGHNAIVAAADLITGIAAMTDRPRVLATPAVISGGRALNIIPDTAVVRANVRVQDTAAAESVERSIAAIVDGVEQAEGIRVEVHGGFTRPPKPREDRYVALLDAVVARAATLGMDLQYADTGGVCDGNLMADAGLVNVDNLGPVGGNLHQVGEYLEADSLVPRAVLTASLLADLPNGVLT